MEETSKLTELLYFYNTWWKTSGVSEELALPHERECLKELIDCLELNRILVLKGPRRTGKSTLLYQMIKHLINAGVPASNILYLSFDEIAGRNSIDEITSAFELILKRPLAGFKNVYFFLDEIQFLDKWSDSLKKYFDTRAHIKFIVSGSSASLLKKGSESLAGRTLERTILPFSFREYLRYHIIDEKLTTLISGFTPDITKPVDMARITPYIPEIEILFNAYLEKGGFPHLFEVKNDTIRKRLFREDIIEKVIYRDLVELFGIKKPFVLERLFLYLADISSGILNISNISSSLGLSREYTENYINYLKNAYLVFSVPKFARSMESRLRSSEKIFVMDTGLQSTFGGAKDAGHIAETAAARHFFHASPYYWRNSHEIDFVLEQNRTITPVEVKYKNTISPDDLGGMWNFLDKFRSGKGVILTKNFTGETGRNGKTIVCKPLWLALLQPEQ